MIDIVFNEFYNKSVQEYLRQNANEAYIQGRHQGWNDVISTIEHMQKNNIEVTPENIYQTFADIMAKENSMQSTPTEASRPGLYVVRNDEVKND